MRMVPGLEDRIMSSSEEEVRHIADLVKVFPTYLFQLLTFS
jgi:hypothetical protein